MVDVGGGASRLVDRLLDLGYNRLSVVDISRSAVELAQARLGDRTGEVTWVTADARHVRLPEPVDVWHDRAVFHFLTEDADRHAYLSSVRAGLKVGGYVIIATFSLEGPERCSGLPVERYDAAKLSAFFGPEFELVRSLERQHVTPTGTPQAYTYAVFQRVEGGRWP